MFHGSQCTEQKSTIHDTVARVGAQTKVLLDSLESQNSRILSALVNPAKVIRAPKPESYSYGSAEEAIMVVRLFLPLFANTAPDGLALRQLLVERVGEKPDYDLTMMRY